MAENDDKYWYNLSTKKVEQGKASPMVDRVGPFDTADEAARAPEVLKERARAWADDEAQEDSWNASEPSTDTDRH